MKKLLILFIIGAIRTTVLANFTCQHENRLEANGDRRNNAELILKRSKRALDYNQQLLKNSQLWNSLRKTNKPIDDRLAKIDRLIKEGAEINARDFTDNGNTALQIAVNVIKNEIDARKAVEFLLSHNADKTITNNDGKNAFDLATTSGIRDVLGSGKRPNPFDDGTTGKRPRPDDTTYEAGGIKNALHGTIYQLKLLMLFLKRGLDKGYEFRLATELNAAEKFDDLVFKYEVDGQSRYRCLQAKHKQDETKKIAAFDLLTTKKDAEYNLQKYFNSYRKIMENPIFHGATFDDFVIATNIDLDDDLKQYFTEITDDDKLLVVDNDAKKTKRYKLTNDPSNTLRNEMMRNLRSSSDLIKLARALSEGIANGASMSLKNEIFYNYHGALAAERIIDVEKKTLHADFVNDNNLSPVAEDFRILFEQSVKETNKFQSPNLWDELKSVELAMSESFGKTFELNPNPQITNVDEFVDAIFQLLQNDRTQSILIELEKTKKGIIRENLKSLAGYIFVGEGRGKSKVLKFSSTFLDPSDATLPPPLQDFKNKLQTKLKGTRGTGHTIEFDDLAEYEFLTKTDYKTCEDGQQNAQKNLPNDPVTDHEMDGFFADLTLAVNQPNEIALGRVIEMELGKEFNSIDSKNIYNYFHVEMLDWMKQKQGVFYTARNAHAFFDRMKAEILGPMWWNVGQLTQHFTGRSNELHQLHQYTRYQKGSTAISHIAVIGGMGGIGKSQLAIKYAHEYGNEYDHVIWISAESDSSIEKSFLDLAKTNKLAIPTFDKDGQPKETKVIIREVYEFVARRKSLFIFDNAEKYRTTPNPNGADDIGIDRYLPSEFIPLNENYPKVIITTRNQDWNDIKVLPLDILKSGEAEDFIRISLKMQTPPTDSQIKLLADKLQRFPLALQQAVAYINKHDSEGSLIGREFSIENYEDVFERKGKEVLNYNFPDDSADPYTKTTLITWEVTLDAIRNNAHGASAHQIFNIMAYLHPDDIPSEIFLNLFADSGEVSASLNLLRQNSIISTSQGNSNVHRLVQKVTRIKLAEHAKDEDTLREAIKLITHNEIRKEYVDHAVSLWGHVFEHDALVHAFNDHPVKIINLLIKDGRYRDAYKFGRRSIDPLSKAIGAENQITLITRSKIAAALANQGKYEKALQIYNDIHDIQQRAHPFAENDPFPLIILDQKALVLNHQGNYDEALVIFQEVYDARRHLLGANHRDTLATLNNMAGIYFSRRELKLALDMFTTVYNLEVERGITLSDDMHRTTLNNIAVCHAEGGEFDEAIRLYNTILEYQMIDDPLGRHPDTLISKNNIATAQIEKGVYDIAFKQYEEIYSIMTSTLGASHPKSLIVRNNMARALDLQGKYAEALQMYREVYPKRVKLLGIDHADTAFTQSRINALEKLTVASSLPKVNLVNCLNPRRKRNTNPCLFSKDDVEKFSIGEIDSNHLETLKIDSEKFLKFIKNNPDENMNTQLMELISESKQIKSNIDDDYKFALKRVIEDQGFEQFVKNERVNQLTGEISRENTKLIKQNKLKSRLEGTAGKIMLIRGIHGAVVACIEGDSKTDCGLSVGGMAWSFVAHPIENVLVKMTPKFLATAGQLAEKVLPGTLAKNSKLVIRLVGVKLGGIAARGIGGIAGGAFDIIDIAMQSKNLVDCKKRAKTDDPCSEKEIRDSIVLISISGVSFVSGIALAAAALPGVGTAVAFALMVGQGIYTGVSNIIEYKDKYHTTDAENWSIFWRSVLLQPMASDLNALVSRTELVNGQAKLAWKFLNESPNNVVAYGIGLGEKDIVPEVRPGYAKILMNSKDADFTKISRVIPDTIENATMICLPQFTQEEFEKDLRKTVPSAVHYCENAMVIADSRRIKSGNSVILYLEHVNSGEVAGSNELKNIFMIFRGDMRLVGGNFTTNRFMLFNPFFNGRIIGGSNSTNILDTSQSTNFELVDIKFAKHSCSRGRLTALLSFNVKLVDDFIDDFVEFRNYYYAGRPNMRDHVSCFTACKNQEILIDSGGGASYVDIDTVRNCNKIVISPFTEVTGGMSDYTLYVKTNGYNGTDLYSSINIERGTVAIIFLEIELVSHSTEIVYLADENTLLVKIKFGENNVNLFTLKIHHYIDRYAPGLKSIFSLFDKHGSNIIPKIPDLEQTGEIDSYELHAGCSDKCSSDDFISVNEQFNEILNTTKEYKVLSIIRDDAKNKNFVYGSQFDDVIYLDAATVFARGRRGKDIYVIDDSVDNRMYRIDNDANDNELDVVLLTNVPTKYSIDKCDLYVKFNQTTTHIVNYGRSPNRRHMIFMNAKGEAFIPRIPTYECSNSTEISGELVRFVHATPTQNMFFLQKDFDDGQIVINAIASDLQVFKDRDDLLIVRDDRYPLIIKIEEFYLNRTKWEKITWLMYNNDTLTRFYGIIFDDNEVTDYKDKIRSSYLKVFKEYARDFSYSESISHNHINYEDDRIGLLIVENISPKNIKVARDGRDLTFTHTRLNKEIRIQNWDVKVSHRISILEFNAALEPITIRGLDRFSLQQVQEIQSLIEKAAQNYENRNNFTLLADAGAKCLISIDGFAKQNSTYRCAGFTSIEEQIRFAEKYCNLEQLISFRENSSTNQVQALLRKLQTDIVLNGYAKNVSDYCSAKLLLSETESLAQDPLESDYKTNLANYLLYMAVRDGSIDVVETLFDGLHVSAKDRDHDGCVPLHWAAKYGRLDIAKYIVSKYTYTFTAKDHRGRTPLHYSSEFGHEDVSQYLINHMPDVNIVDNDGKRPIDLAPKKNIIDAVKQAELDKQLLVASRTDLDTAKNLVEQGANPNAKDSDERSALHYAAFEGKLNIVKYLLEQKVDINNSDVGNETPLDQVFRHIIIFSGRKPSNFFKPPNFDELLDVADYLIVNLATINITNRPFKAVKELAAKKPHTNVVEFLQNYY